jgi:hypothetical protein
MSKIRYNQIIKISTDKTQRNLKVSAKNMISIAIDIKYINPKILLGLKNVFDLNVFI